MPLSKSSFLKYLQCPSYFWFAQNKPEVLAATALSDFEQMLAEQGKKVEILYYSLFPDLKIVGAKGSEAISETQNILQQGASRIAQAAFEAESFFAQADLVHFKGHQHIDIYEVKSSSSMQNMGLDDSNQAPSKEEHITDLAFQYVVASLAGFTIDSTWLVELNKSYSHASSANPSDLFTVSDVTKEVLAQIPAIRNSMQEALLQTATIHEPTTCDCRYKSRKKQCPAFAYLHPGSSGYSIYDLPRIHPTRLREFVDQGIIRIEDIPTKNKLSDNQQDHVRSWNENTQLIQSQEINAILGQLEYPLYFLDYETYGPAIPVFEGTRPYQHIPFQYSLHIIPEVGAEVIHREYLHPDSTSPMADISKNLRSEIGDQGTIIVWNKTFESKCHENLSNAVPEHAAFLLGMNRRMFDLMDIFSKRLYVNKDFRGSASIKKVLPVLVPKLSYKDLIINDGGKATTEWSRMVFELNDDSEKETIRTQLLEYCKLDTLAMVEIYNKLKELI